MLETVLKERDLLPILQMEDGSAVTADNWEARRKEMKALLEEYSYGLTPPAPVNPDGSAAIKAEIIRTEDPHRFAGKVKEERIRVSFEAPKGECSIEFTLLVPEKKEPMPVFLALDFERIIPNRRLPASEITDRGYAIASLCYLDMVNDNLSGDYSDGMAVAFGTDNDRSDNEWGKIGMWAYGASRILDYLLTRDDIDAKKTIVIGHSRLGKTALWAGAQDERFWGVVSNNSGYGGAATSKHGSGECVNDFIRCGSWDWYCENFKKFADKEDDKPYDQAFLLALIAPRYLCVGSAKLDRGADPESEFLTSLWASQAWELLGEKGLVTPDRMPEIGDKLQEGKVGYHLRDGLHSQAREDWLAYMAFFDSKLEKERN